MRANRDYRRKSEEVLAEVKPGIASDDVESVADDLTAARFRKSISRKRLHKTGTVTIGEKVKIKLEKREDAVGRNVRRHRSNLQEAAAAVSALRALRGDKLIDVVRRADRLCTSHNADELKRVRQSDDPVDRAIFFLYGLSWGSVAKLDGLKMNPELDRDFRVWVEKANRIIERDKRERERKSDQKDAARKKLRALRGTVG